MRYCVIDDTGRVVNVIIAEPETATDIERATKLRLVPHPLAGPGWTMDEAGTFTPPAPAAAPPSPVESGRAALLGEIERALRPEAGLAEIKQAIAAIKGLLA